MTAEQMIIAGAGECGTRAAFALREQGFDGDIILIGEEMTDPYERPPLSKQFLLERGEADQENVPYIADDQRFAEANIRFLQGHRVTTLQPAEHCITVQAPDGSNHELPYSRLLLATGTRARELPVPGVADHPHCHYLRTLQDARTLYQALQQASHLLVVGGGLIGLELAASARKLGVEVTVLEVAPRILGRAVPEIFAHELHQRHQQEGVAIRCGVILQAVGYKNDGSGVTVELADGETLAADLMIIGIGAVPDQALAEMAGLEVNNGVVVNEHLQTSDADIFAAGDCCSYPASFAEGHLRLETWRNAQSQGTLAAQNMLGQQQVYDDVPWFWSDQYDLGLQVAGLSNAVHTTVQRSLKNGAVVQFELTDSGRLVAAAGLGKGNSVAKEIRLAEMLIAKAACPDPAQLADAAVNLKKLLR